MFPYFYNAFADYSLIDNSTLTINVRNDISGLKFDLLLQSILANFSRKCSELRLDARKFVVKFQSP